MFDVEKEYKNIVTRIGITLIFFLFVSNLLVGCSELANLLCYTFIPESDVLYIVTDLVSSFAYLFSFILPVPFFYMISKGSVTHPLNLAVTLPSPFSGIKLFAIIMAGLAVITSASYLNSLIFPVSGDAVSELTDLDFSSPYMLVLGFISTALFPAFAEEFLFRCLIVSNIKPYSKSAAVVLSAVAFGLMHQNPMQLLFATAAGVAFGIIYVETDSIWCCIALHFINNFISLMQSYVYYVFNGEVAALLNYFFDVFVTLVGLICAICLLLSVKKKKTKAGVGVYGDYKFSEEKRITAFDFSQKALTNPAFFVFLLFCVIQSVVVGVMLKTM